MPDQGDAPLSMWLGDGSAAVSERLQAGKKKMLPPNKIIHLRLDKSLFRQRSKIYAQIWKNTEMPKELMIVDKLFETAEMDILNGKVEGRQCK